MQTATDTGKVRQKSVCRTCLRKCLIGWADVRKSLLWPLPLVDFTAPKSSDKNEWNQPNSLEILNLSYKKHDRCNNTNSNGALQCFNFKFLNCLFNFLHSIDPIATVTALQLKKKSQLFPQVTDKQAGNYHEINLQRSRWRGHSCTFLKGLASNSPPVQTVCTRRPVINSAS